MKRAPFFAVLAAHILICIAKDRTCLPVGSEVCRKIQSLRERLGLLENANGSIKMLLFPTRFYSEVVCGGKIEEAKGTIKSPFLRQHHLPHKNCTWEITAPPYHRIILNFTYFDLERNNDNCDNESVLISSKTRENEAFSHGKFCGSQIPPITMSKANNLKVEFTSNSNIEGKGFVARFFTDYDECAIDNGGCQHVCENTIGNKTCLCDKGYILQKNLHDCKEETCGGVFEGTNGTIISPSFPGQYPPNKNCTWIITAPLHHRIILNFTHFDLQRNEENCRNDSVIISSKAGENEFFEHGKFCGTKLPPMLMSEANILKVVFTSDSSFEGEGFRANYFAENDECAMNRSLCQHICNKTIGSYLCSCRNGYALHENNHDCYEKPCGGVLMVSNGTIVSPFFPDQYPPNKICVWEIVGRTLDNITLSFTHFDLEGNNEGCEYDSVNVVSKSGGSVLNHGTFCGSGLPTVIGPVNNLKITFKSDNTIQKGGFQAHFGKDVNECASSNGGCHQICNNTIGSYTCSCRDGYVLHKNGRDCEELKCTHEITRPVGEIASPNYPSYYSFHHACSWSISVTPGHRIMLQFTDFKLEQCSNCGCDSVTVYDEDSSGVHHGTFCGTQIPRTILTWRNRLYIRFRSDRSVLAKGFKANYTTVCGGTVNANSEVEYLYSHSKYGDQNYDNVQNCRWVIDCHVSERISLRFMNFDLENDFECRYDFVQVYDGDSDSTRSLGRFCGNQLPHEIRSSGPSLLLIFRSDGSSNAKGFSAAYSAVSISEHETTESYYPTTIHPYSTTNYPTNHPQTVTGMYHNPRTTTQSMSFWG